MLLFISNNIFDGLTTLLPNEHDKDVASNTTSPLKLSPYIFLMILSQLLATNFATSSLCSSIHLAPLTNASCCALVVGLIFLQPLAPRVLFCLISSIMLYQIT
jgi:hypothetical protein